MKRTPEAIDEVAQTIVARRQGQGHGKVLQTWNTAESIGCAVRMRQDLRALRLRQASVLLALCVLLAACAPTSVQPAPSAAPTATLELVFANDDALVAAPRLVLLERNAAAAQDLPTLAALWAEDGRIIERRDSADTADDYTWQGREAILDRYKVAVFPNPPTPLDAPPDAPVTVDGDTARLVNGVDAWQFVWRDGRWWIAELVIG